MSIRIYGNRAIKTLPGLDCRPTSVRVRQALFNIWQGQIQGCRWLDLCTGSGAIAAEALCRGASIVLGIEESPIASKLIRENCQKLVTEDSHFRLINGRVQKFLPTLAGQQFDRIYCDPPYQGNLYQRMLSAIEEHQLLAHEGEIDLGHSYDGIRELDNRLPPWWVNMFVLTVIWSVGYMYYYHWGGSGMSSKEEYNTEMAVAKKEIALALAGKADALDESNVTALTESSAISEGELIFKNVCVACHGTKGEGTVGPNFTDEYWIHGGGIKNIFKTIKYGVPDKGMISWQAQLKPSDMQKVSSYILTLGGTNPPNPKAPQGTIWVDSTAVQALSPAK